MYNEKLENLKMELEKYFLIILGVVMAIFPIIFLTPALPVAVMTGFVVVVLVVLTVSFIAFK